MEQNLGSQKINLSLWSTNFQQGCPETMNGERTVFTTNVNGTGYLNVESKPRYITLYTKY